MASGLSLEILDLRHFAAPMLRPVLEAESAIWRERLNWDYLASAKLLLQYLDSRSLPGYVAVDSRAGHRLCLLRLRRFEGRDRRCFRFAGRVATRRLRISGGAAGHRVQGREVEDSLLQRLLELLLHSPGVDRIESQLLLHRDGEHSEIFLTRGLRCLPAPLSAAQPGWRST
jgi:hypothetical protein